MATYKPTFDEADFRIAKTVAPEGVYSLTVGKVKLHKSAKTGSKYLTASVTFSGDDAQKYKGFIIRPIMLEGTASEQGARFLQAVLGAGEAGKAAVAKAEIITVDELNEFNAKEGVEVSALSVYGSEISLKGATINASVKQGPLTNSDGTTRKREDGSEIIVNSVGSIW